MRRREFLAASAAALVCTARLAADEKAAEKPREPDLRIKSHRGCIAFSPDSKVLAVANGPIGDEEGICFLDPASGKRLDDFERATDVGTTVGYKWPRILAFSKDGKWFAAGGEGYVALWDAQTGRRLPDIQLPDGQQWGPVRVLAFTADSKYLFAGRGFWPLAPRGEVEHLLGLERYGSVAFAPNGKLFATRFEGQITIWEYPKRQKLKVIGRKQRDYEPLLFTPDGKEILSWHEFVAGQPQLFWNVETGDSRTIQFENEPGFHLDISPDGTLLLAITAKELGLFKINNGQSTQFLASYSGHFEDDLVDLRFAPNQKIIACSRVYSGIRIWKDENGFKA
jgi:WD40 repeat protein